MIDEIIKTNEKIIRDLENRLEKADEIIKDRNKVIDKHLNKINSLQTEIETLYNVIRILAPSKPLFVSDKIT